MDNDQALIKEYLANSKKQFGQLAAGIILGSLVFFIPVIIIGVNGWWGPFDNDPAVGIRWFIVACIAMGLMYIALIIDKFTRKF